MRTNLSSKSVPRIELDQRSRAARLRFERIDRLLMLRAAVKISPLKRLLCLFSVGIYGGAPRESRTRGPLSDRRPSRMPAVLAHAHRRCMQTKAYELPNSGALWVGSSRG